VKRLAILLAVVLALGAGWYFGSPLWTLQQMKSAAEKGDAKALSAHVDFPAVRESLKPQLGVKIGASRALPELGVLGDLLGDKLSEAAVDLLVRPEALRVVFATSPAAAAAPAKLRLRAPEMDLRYEGIDQFRLVNRDGSGGALIFRRHGIGWKLTGVTLPEGSALP
jgi:hypothetical protein